MKHSLRGIPTVMTLIAMAAAGCGGTTTTASYSYYDPYAYYSYYPTDVYYSGYAWTDPYSVYYYTAISSPLGTTVVSGDGGVGSHLQNAGDVIRALAQGQSVCPNQVTVTPRTAPDVCPAGGSATIRNGVTIAFNGCMLPDGGRVDGTYDVQATRTTSDPACGAGATISLSITTTVTNLSFVGAGGRKIVIPNETGTSSFSYVIGQAPQPTASTIEGRMQVFASDGSKLADNTFSGTSTTTPAQDRSSYSIDGTLTLQDQLAAGSTTTLTAAGLTRSSSCCRPIGGTLTLNRTGGANAGTHTFSFGPSCGATTFDDKAVTLPNVCL